MRRLAVLGLLTLALAGCGSTAPYTMGAAVLNSAVAVGASAAQKAGGGCYAVCTNGTVCNARTGFCEARSAGQYCEEAPGGGMRCIPVDVTGAMSRTSEAGGGATPVDVGVSPATGSVPPPPSEASPRGP